MNRWQPRPFRATQPSGQSWLGNIPVHWELRRTKTLLAERTEKGHPDRPLLAATQSRGVVRKDRLETRTVLATKDLHLLKAVEVGDFVISLRSFQGGIEYARESGIISPAYTVLYPKEDRHQRYLAALFKSKPFVDALVLAVTGIREGQNVDYGRLGRSSLPLPPASEQAAIARFLDLADRRIQRYIAAKEKLIALLAEFKQSLVHQAVTGQVDVRTGAPYGEYKDTGVQWLGRVPGHWNVSTLRHRYEQCLGKMLDASRVTGSYLVPYLRNVDVQWDCINVAELPEMDIPPAEVARFTVRKGDLLVCEGGEMGRAAIWSGEDGVIGYQKALHRLRPKVGGRDVPRFLFYALSLASTKGAFQDGHESTIAHLTGEKLRSHRFAFPSASDQREIVRFLDTQLERVDAVARNERRLSDRLHEYRTRLVADVVTGKLDVREAAAALPDLDAREPNAADLKAELDGAAAVT